MNSVSPIRVYVSRRLVGLVIGCSALVAHSTAVHAADLTGCWEGKWYSCTDRFKGTVKARITKCDENRYHAEFSGRAFIILPYRYSATLIATTDEETGHVHFKSSRKLPIWGCYWVNGCACNCKLVAKYHTDDHTGYFTMRRTCCH